MSLEIVFCYQFIDIRGLHSKNKNIIYLSTRPPRRYVWLFWRRSIRKVARRFLNGFKLSWMWYSFRIYQDKLHRGLFSWLSKNGKLEQHNLWRNWCLYLACLLIRVNKEDIPIIFQSVPFFVLCKWKDQILII